MITRAYFARFYSTQRKIKAFFIFDQHTNANIKSAFCDCLAEMGCLVFSNLPEAKKIVCITFVLGQCSSQPPSTGDDNQVLILYLYNIMRCAPHKIP
jgi:hypothetical protein